MTRPVAEMKNWGDLNIALNGLVRQEIILGYKTNRAEKSAAPSIEVSIDAGADQADVVRQVRGQLSGIFADAVVRTKAS